MLSSTINTAKIMVQILSIEEAKRGTSLVKVEMTSGDVFNIGFLSLMPARDAQRYRAVIQKCLDEFEKSGSDDLFNDLARRMLQNGFEMPFYVMPDRNDERTRIGKRIKELREAKEMEAKKLSQLTDIDAANLCRIEQGRYSAGLDMLCKIATALDAKVDIIPNKIKSDPEDFSLTRKAWVVPSNIEIFDIRSCICEFGYCYWQQHYNFQIGDIIYIYATKPYQEICFKFIVTDSDLFYNDEIATQDKFWHSPESIERGKENGRYARIKYMGELHDKQAVSLDTLMKRGYLKAAPQGAICIGEDFARYLENAKNIKP